MLKTEGIILNVLPFQENHLIFTLFSPDLGLAKFLYKHALSSKKSLAAQLTPFTRAEWIYKEARSDLLPCTDASILDQHLSLRKSLAILDSAGSMVQVIKETQQSGKAAPLLYQLLLSYLHHLPSFPDPLVLSCSFKLKVLRYEGFWVPNQDEDLLLLLSYSRSMTDLAAACPLPAEIVTQIDDIYHQHGW